jgi:cytoskeleton protein RodZ
MTPTPPPFHDYRDIGRMLRDTRESMGLATEQVAAQLRVRNKYLQSLEKGELGDIPGEVYARGYLKLYADFLGYDGQQILNQVNAAPVQAATQYLPPEKEEQTRSTLFALLASLLALLAVVLWQMSQQKEDHPLNLVDAVPSMAPASGMPQNPSQASAFPELCDTSGENLLPDAVCRGDALLTTPEPDKENALTTIMELEKPDAMWRPRM